MKPSRKEIIGFLLSNDARTRSGSRDALTKKILKTLRKEAPRVYWSHYGALAAVFALMILPLIPIFVDPQYTGIMFSLYFAMAMMFLGIPVFAYSGYKTFKTYFDLYPGDFPRSEDN